MFQLRHTIFALVLGATAFGETGHSGYGTTSSQRGFGAQGGQQGNQTQEQQQQAQQMIGNAMMQAAGGQGQQQNAKYESKLEKFGPEKPDASKKIEKMEKGTETMAKQLSEGTKATTESIAKTTADALKESQASILETLKALSAIPAAIDKESVMATSVDNKRAEELLALKGGVNAAAIATVQKAGSGAAAALEKVGNGLTPHNAGGAGGKKNEERLYDVSATTVASSDGGAAASGTVPAVVDSAPKAFRGAYRAPASQHGILK